MLWNVNVQKYPKINYILDLFLLVLFFFIRLSPNYVEPKWRTTTAKRTTSKCYIQIEKGIAYKNLHTDLSNDACWTRTTLAISSLNIDISLIFCCSAAVSSWLGTHFSELFTKFIWVKANCDMYTFILLNFERNIFMSTTNDD